MGDPIGATQSFYSRGGGGGGGGGGGYKTQVGVRVLSGRGGGATQRCFVWVRVLQGRISPFPSAFFSLDGKGEERCSV